MLHSLVSGADSLAASHGFAINLAIVIVLAATGCCLLTGRAAVVRPAAIAAIVLCVADWVLVQDLGFLGGLGTDPNSMVPQALILTAGLVAMIAIPAAASAQDGASPPAACSSAGRRRRREPGARRVQCQFSLRDDACCPAGPCAASASP